jgi:hypothetical protein
MVDDAAPFRGACRAQRPGCHLTVGGACAFRSSAPLAAWQLFAPEQPAADRPARFRLVDRVQEQVEQWRPAVRESLSKLVH